MAIDVNQFNADLDLLHDDVNNKVHPFTHGDETTDVELGGKATPSIRKLVKQVQDDQNTIKDEIIQIKDDIVDDAARLAEEAAADASAEAEKQANLAKDHADRAEAALGLAEGQLPVPATQEETNEGIHEFKYITPKTLNVWGGEERYGRLITISSDTVNLPQVANSVDNGVSWFLADELPVTKDARFYDTIIQLASGRLLVFVSNESSSDYKCLKSDDGGEHWEILLTFTSTNHSWVGAVIVTPSNRIIALAYGSSICLMSDDEGENWFSSNIGLTLGWHRCIGTAKSGRIIAISLSGTQEYAYTDDEGANWSRGQLPTADLTFRSRLHVMPSGRVIAIAFEGGAYLYTDDEGANWQESTLPITDKQVYGTSAVLPGGRLLVVLNNEARCLYTDDEGANWQESTLPITGSWAGSITVTGTGRVVILPHGSDRTYCCFSDDYGVTWTLVADVLPATGLRLGALITTARAVDLKADKHNPYLSGIPTVPEAPRGTNSDQIATTSFANYASLVVPFDHYREGTYNFNDFVAAGTWEFNAGPHLAGPPAFDGTNVAAGTLRVMTSSTRPQIIQEYTVWHAASGEQQGMIFRRACENSTAAWSAWKYFSLSELDAKLAAINTSLRQTHFAQSTTWVSPISGLVFFLMIGGGGAGGGCMNGNLGGGGGGAGGFNLFQALVNKGDSIIINVGAGGASTSNNFSYGGGSTTIGLPNGRLFGVGGGGGGGCGASSPNQLHGSGGGAGGSYLEAATAGARNLANAGGAGSGLFAGEGGTASATGVAGNYGGSCLVSQATGGSPGAIGVVGVAGQSYTSIRGQYSSNYGFGGNGAASSGAWGPSGIQGFVAAYY